MTYDITQCRNDFENMLKNFTIVGQYSGRGGEVTIYAGSLPISMPALSLRDSRVYGGLTFQGKDIIGIETYAHARDYAEGEQVGIVVRSKE